MTPVRMPPTRTSRRAVGIPKGLGRQISSTSFGPLLQQLAMGDLVVVDRDGKGLAEKLQAVRKQDQDNGREITPGLLRLEARLRQGR